MIEEVGIAVGSFNDLIRSRYEHPLVKDNVVKISATIRKIFRGLNRSNHVMWKCDII